MQIKVDYINFKKLIKTYFPLQDTYEEEDEFITLLRNELAKHEIMLEANKSDFSEAVNAVKCLKCGDIIESVNVNDFKYCSCGNIGITGGDQSKKRIGNIFSKTWIDLSINIEN